MRFWFRYVFPYQSFLELGQTNWVMDKIKAEFAQHVSLIFEDICLRMVPVCFGATYNLAGSHWEANMEIDLVATREDGKDVLYGECKWQEQPVGREVYEALVAKSKSINPWGKLRSPKITYSLFAKNGFTDELKKLAGPKLRLIDFSSLGVKY